MNIQAHGTGPAAGPETDGRSDFKVVAQFFLVPLSLVAVLVSLFFGLQLLRGRRPDPQRTLQALQRYDGFLGALVGDLKRWQSGYDLSLLLRSQSPEELRRMVPDLIVVLRDAGARRDLKLRRYLTLALGHASDPRAVEPLREALRDDDAETRLLAAWGLMRVGGATALPDLRSALSDEDAGVRKVAAFALGALGDSVSVAGLRAVLADRVEDVGWNAALALARLGDASAVPVLLAMLERGLEPATPDGAGPPADLAVNAARGLAILHASEARPLLERASASGDAQIRAAARQALETLSAAKPVAEAARPEIR